MDGQESLVTVVRKTVADALGIESRLVSVESQPGSIPEWDSLGNIQVQFALMEAFGLSEDDDSLFDCEDVGQIADTLSRRLGGKE